MSNYSYPISTDWTTEEIIRVTNFYNAVETAYENGIDLLVFQKNYNQFKKIVTSKMEEKQIGKQFETISGYSIYRAVKQMKNLLAESKSTGKDKQTIYLQD